MVPQRTFLLEVKRLREGKYEDMHSWKVTGSITTLTYHLKGIFNKKIDEQAAEELISREDRKVESTIGHNNIYVSDLVLIITEIG